MSFRESNFLVVCVLGQGLRNEVPLNSAIITTVLHVYYYQCLSYETMATLKRSPNNRVTPPPFLQNQPEDSDTTTLSQSHPVFLSVSWDHLPPILLHQAMSTEIISYETARLLASGSASPKHYSWLAQCCRLPSRSHPAWRKKMMMLPGWLDSDFMGKSE